LKQWGDAMIDRRGGWRPGAGRPRGAVSRERVAERDQVGATLRSADFAEAFRAATAGDRGAARLVVQTLKRAEKLRLLFDDSPAPPVCKAPQRALEPPPDLFAGADRPQRDDAGVG
jgi:hypothetical protein